MDIPEIRSEKSSEKDKLLPRGSKIIRIDCEESEYSELLDDPEKFKIKVDEQIRRHPELFPEKISDGYALYGKGRCSAKLDELQFRRIKINKTGEVFSIYPSFVMPYLIGYTYEVEKALMLRKHDVPYSSLVYVFGKDEMYWYRAEQAFSRCSIVGTTIKKRAIA